MLCDVGDELEPFVDLYMVDADGDPVLIYKAGKRYKVIGNSMPRDVRVVAETGADSTLGVDYFLNFRWFPLSDARTNLK